MPETYDPRPGLRLLSAILADDAAGMRAAQETDPLGLTRALGSIALMWGFQLHGPKLAEVVDLLVLDLDVDPITGGTPDA